MAVPRLLRVLLLRTQCRFERTPGDCFRRGSTAVTIGIHRHGWMPAGKQFGEWCVLSIQSTWCDVLGWTYYWKRPSCAERHRPSWRQRRPTGSLSTSQIQRFRSVVNICGADVLDYCDGRNRAEDGGGGDGPGLRHARLSGGHSHTQAGATVGAYEEREERQQVR